MQTITFKYVLSTDLMFFHAGSIDLLTNFLLLGGFVTSWKFFDRKFYCFFEFVAIELRLIKKIYLLFISFFCNFVDTQQSTLDITKFQFKKIYFLVFYSNAEINILSDKLRVALLHSQVNASIMGCVTYENYWINRGLGQLRSLQEPGAKYTLKLAAELCQRMRVVIETDKFVITDLSIHLTGIDVWGSSQTPPNVSCLNVGNVVHIVKKRWRSVKK